MVTGKATKTSRKSRPSASHRRSGRLRLSCQYSVSASHGIVLSLTFSNRNRRDLARERYLDSLTRQAKTVPNCWVGRLPAHQA